MNNVKFEAEFNLFRRVVMLVRHNAVSVILTLLLIGLTAAMYLSFQYAQKQIDKIQIAVAPDESHVVLAKYESDKQINKIIIDLRDSLDADRVKVFQYHNSIRSVGGISFLYVSATNEVIRPGVSSELQNLQRLPAVIFSLPIERYLKDEDGCIPPTEFHDSAIQQLLANQGIHIVCNYPIKMDDNIVGFLTINFNTDRQFDHAKVLDLIKIAAIKIGVIFERLST